MHDSSQYVRWETAVSDASVLMMKLSCHDGDLKIMLDRSLVSEPQVGVQMIFGRCPAFRSILEKFRTDLWTNLAVSGRPGRTFIVENSPWIADLKASEPMFSFLNENIRHYVIATDWEVVEVLSNNAPVISPWD